MAVVIGVRGSRSLRRWFTRGADTAAWFLAAEMRKALAPADGRVLSDPTREIDLTLNCRVRGFGITAPEFATTTTPGLDVRGKAVLVFDSIPATTSPRTRSTAGSRQNCRARSLGP